MIDLWATYDVPVLAELVERLEVNGEPLVDRPDTLAGFMSKQYGGALRRLEAHGYIKAEGSLASRDPETVTAVTEKGLRAVGAWPSPDQFADRLLAALEDAAAHAGSEEERSRARRVLEALRAGGRDLLVNAAGGALGGMALGG